MMYTHISQKVMNNFCRMTALCLLSYASSMSGALLECYEFSGNNLQMSHHLGKLCLAHEKKQFKVIAEDGTTFPVQNAFVDKEIRNISTDRLALLLGLIQKVSVNGKEETVVQSPLEFLVSQDATKGEASVLPEVRKNAIVAALAKSGYLELNQMSDGQYSVRSHMRLSGGGPVAGAIAYGLTKALCYGTAAAAATTAVVTTGGVLSATTGGLVAYAGAQASTASTVVGGVLVATGHAAEATTITTSVVAASGGIAGAVAAVETASAAAGSFFLTIPFLP